MKDLFVLLCVTVAILSDALPLNAEQLPICAPMEYETDVNKLVPIYRESAQRDGRAVEAGASAFVVDISLGMAGFIRKTSGQHEKMLFGDIVVAAKDAYADLKSGYGFRSKSESGVYALNDTKTVEFDLINNALAPCQKDMSDRKNCKQDVNGNTTGFHGKSNIVSLLDRLGGKDGGAADVLSTQNGKISEADLFVLVTDLQNESNRKGAGQLGELLRKIIVASNVTVAVFPFLSHYSGYIYDLPNLDAAYKLENGRQPFFIVVVGSENIVFEFVDIFNQKIDQVSLGYTVEQLYQGGKAIPPLFFGNAIKNPHDATLKQQFTTVGQSNLTRLRKELLIVDDAGIQGKISHVTLKRAEILKAEQPEKVATIDLREFVVPKNTDLNQYCLKINGGAEFCPYNKTNGARNENIPNIDRTEDNIWVLKKARFDLLNWITATASAVFTQPSAHSTACEYLESSQYEMKPGDQPFSTRTVLRKSEDGKGALILSLEIWFDPGQTPKTTFKTSDKWIVATETTGVVTRATMQPNWLANESGWSVNLTSVKANMKEPIGVAGLARFFSSLRSEREKSGQMEEFNLTIKQSVLFAIE